MPDDTTKNDFDADILQGKADVMKILRSKTNGSADGSAKDGSSQTVSTPDVSTAKSNTPSHPVIQDVEFISNVDSFPDLDLSDLEDEHEPTTPKTVAPQSSVASEKKSNVQKQQTKTALPDLQKLRQELAAEKDEKKSLQLQLQQLLKQALNLQGSLEDMTNHSLEKNKDHDRLKNKLSQLQDENRQLQSDIYNHQKDLEQMQQMRSELSETEVALSRERNKATQFENKTAELETQLQEAVEERDRLREQFDQVDEKREKLSDDFDRLASQHAEEHEQFGRQVEGLKKQLEQVSGDCAVLKQDYDQLSSEYEAYQKQTEEEIRLLNERNQELALQAQTSDEKMLGYQQSAKGHTNQILEKDEVIDLLRKELSESKEHHSKELEKSTQFAEELAVHRGELEDAHQLVKSLQEQLALAESDEGKLQHELASLKEQYQAQCDELNSQLTNLEQANRELSQQHAQLQREYDIYKQNIQQYTETLEAEVAEYASENQTLRSDCENYRKVASKKDSWLHEIESLKTANEQLEQAGLDIQEQLESMQALRESEIEDLKTTTAALTNENERLTVETKKQQKTITSLKADIEQNHIQSEKFEEIQTFLKMAQETNERLKKENTSLQDQLQQLQSDLDKQATAVTTVANITDIETIHTVKPLTVNDETVQEEPLNFELAEQIMSAHRKSVANRRRRLVPAQSKAKTDSVRHVVEQYIKAQPSRPEIVTTPTLRSFRTIRNDATLTQFQQQILQEIIERDIRHCRVKKAV